MFFLICLQVTSVVFLLSDFAFGLNPLTIGNWKNSRELLFITTSEWMRKWEAFNEKHWAYWTVIKYQVPYQLVCATHCSQLTKKKKE